VKNPSRFTPKGGTMSELQIKTLNGQLANISTQAFDALQANLRGALLHPDDDGYEAARQVWNGMSTGGRYAGWLSRGGSEDRDGSEGQV
jgi:hypothetical protein